MIIDTDETDLDVGCFVGKFTSMLPGKTVGIDSDPNYIKYAKKHYRTRDNDFFCMDAANMDFDDNKFYTAWVLEVLEHVEDPIAILTEVERVVKPEGIIIITVPAPGKSYQIDPENHLHDFSVEWFKDRYDVKKVFQMGTDESPYHVYIIRNTVK
jgi:2-polyprenyl-3-methyl-5-hydroxy-6-metoxy-1,4-benzoquinol methylase